MDGYPPPPRQTHPRLHIHAHAASTTSPQANALNLFTAALALLHACRPPTPGGLLGAGLAPLVTPAAVAAVGAVGYAVVTSNGAVTASERYTGPSNARPAAAAE